MKKQFTLILLLITNLVVVNSLQSQDAMVIGFNYDNADGVAIVALKDLPSSTNLFLTETDYSSASNSFNRDGSNDGTWKINWGGTWTKGTILVFEEASGNTFSVTASANAPSAASVSMTSPYGDGISFSNEGFSIFTSNNLSDPDPNVIEISSFTHHSTSTGLDPDPSDDLDCPCTPTFVSVDLATLATDHGQFRPSLRGGTIYKSVLENAANWDQSSSNNSLSLTEFTGQIALPIELQKFTAKKMESEVALNWTTLSEINNDFFTLEHSLDGIQFNSIAEIKGAINSTQTLNYSYIHDTPANTINYYRLKQTDLDGRFSYSNMRAVDFVAKVNESINAFPNPFTTDITIDLPTSISLEADIKVFDMLGRMVKVTTLSKDKNQMLLNFNELDSGIYSIQVGDGDNAIIQQVVKL